MGTGVAVGTPPNGVGVGVPAKGVAVGLGGTGVTVGVPETVVGVGDAAVGVNVAYVTPTPGVGVNVGGVPVGTNVGVTVPTGVPNGRGENTTVGVGVAIPPGSVGESLDGHPAKRMTIALSPTQKTSCSELGLIALSTPVETLNREVSRAWSFRPVLFHFDLLVA